MTEQPHDLARILASDDAGDFAIVDSEEIESRATELAALMLTIPAGDESNAAMRLLQITEEPAYRRVLALRTLEMAMAFALEAANPVQVSIIPTNAAQFILAFRGMQALDRIDVASLSTILDSTPDGDSDD